VLQSTPESGSCAGDSGAKRRKGSKAHLAVDTLGHLLALTVTPASDDERTQVGSNPNTASASHSRRISLLMRYLPGRRRAHPPPSLGGNTG
jgi:hypothetical protein